MTVFDHALMFQSTGNVTTSGYLTNALKIYGTPIKGSGVRVSIPSANTQVATVLPQLYVSDDNSTYVLAASYPGGAKTIAAGGEDLIFGFISNKRYAKLYIAVGSGTTATSFGAVQAGFVEGVGFDWSRAVDFSQD